jgi:uncharacterized membrane protein YeiH
MWKESFIVIEFLAIASGCLSGVLHALRRNFDIVGVMIIGIASGVGGGILRDILISDGPPLVIKYESYLITILSATFVGMFFGTLINRIQKVIWHVDAFSLGFFTIAGMQRGFLSDLSVLPALFLGIITATGGGLLRDVLSRETPIILLPGHPHTLASLLGGVVYMVFIKIFGYDIIVSEVIGVISTYILKLLALKYDLIVPTPPDVMHHIQRFLTYRKSKRKK